LEWQGGWQAMVENASRYRFGILLITLLGLHAVDLRADITIGSLVFDDDAFADRVISTDFTGFADGCVGQPMSTVDDAIAGFNLGTWANYGEHDLSPGEDGDYNSSAPPNQYIELGFVDNAALNGVGHDLVIFQIGALNSVRVAVDKASILNPYAPGSVSVIADAGALPGSYNMGCTGTVTVIYVDLSDLGVPEGESIYRVFLTSPLMSNGDVGWNNPAYPAYGVPELAGVAAWNSIPKGNSAPEVDAGHDVVVSLPQASAILNGSAVDDSQAAASLTYSWSQVGGSLATISDPTDASTGVTLPGVGVYEFQLSVSDGALTAADVVSVEVTASDLVAPSMPGNFVAELLNQRRVHLSWDVSSDNVSVRRYSIYRNGVLLISTTDLSFTDINTEYGARYVYRVVAEDAAGNVSASTAEEPVDMPDQKLVIVVSQDSDNAEECVDGSVTIGDADLDFGNSGLPCGDQLVGLRFPNVAVPERAEIKHAWLVLVADEVDTDPTALNIAGIAEDSVTPFSTDGFDVSSRSLTGNVVEWVEVPAWNLVGEWHNSPDLSAIVQELVDRDGWLSGHALGFVLSGAGVRVAESSVTSARAPRLLIEYVDGPPINQTPVVDAGGDTSITLPQDTLSLSGSVSDDGVNLPLTFTWSLLSGPAAVSFSDDSLASPEVTFSSVGQYVLEFTASDGEFQHSDTVTITVHGPDVEAPTQPQNLVAEHSGLRRVSLAWDSATDNTGVVGYRLYRDHAVIGETAQLQFMDDSALESLTFYEYQVAALDGAGNESTLSDIEGITTLEVPETIHEFSVAITQTSDDAEEIASGRVITGSQPLELVYADVGGAQHVGLRFPNIDIPRNAIIDRAWIQFAADGDSSGAVSIVIEAFDDVNPGTFVNDPGGTSTFSISSRARFGSINWSDIPAWTDGELYETPDLSAIVQDLVGRDGWQSGNSIGFVLSGTGTRNAEIRPALFIEYVDGPPANEPPVAEAGNNASIRLPVDTLNLGGSVVDDDVSGVMALSWSLLSGPAGVTFSDASSATSSVTFTNTGTYVLQLTADDGEFESTDTVSIEVLEPDLEPPTQPLALSASVAGISGIVLVWDASTDNIGVSGYRIYRNGALLATATDSAYLDSVGLAEDTEYAYFIIAVDESGNESTASDLSVVTTLSTPESVTRVEVLVGSVGDDAEEAEDGRVFLDSSRIELGYEAAAGAQYVGLRFQNVQVPKNATITRAWLRFQSSEDSAEPVSLFVFALDDANPVAFSDEDFNLTNRPVLDFVAAWPGVEAWSIDQNYSSPDLALQVQTLVNNADWQPGNAIGFLVAGDGGTNNRVAKHFRSGTNSRPRLFVEYAGGDSSGGIDEGSDSGEGNSGGGGALDWFGLLILFVTAMCGRNIGVRRPFV
jgi:chitodextrinase